MRRLAIPLLSGLNFLVVIALAWAWWSPATGIRNIHWAAPAPIQVDLQTLLPPLPGPGLADTSQFIAMLDRPVFSPTRRPPPPPPPPAPAEPVDRFAQAKLTGLYEGQGVGGVILNLDGKDRRVALNSAIEGWRLQSVGSGQASFSKGGQTRVLGLTRASLASYTGVPQQSAAAPAPAAAVDPVQPQPGANSARSSTRSARNATANGAGESATPATPATPPRPSFGGRTARP